MCACVYVGGVARLLLDPRPPMRERETPPPSWGGHHRQWVVGSLGGRTSYELLLVIIIIYYFIFWEFASRVCVCARADGIIVAYCAWQGALSAADFGRSRHVGRGRRGFCVRSGCSPCVARSRWMRIHMHRVLCGRGRAGMGCRGSCGAHVRGSRFIVVHRGTSGRLCGAWADGA